MRSRPNSPAVPCSGYGDTPAFQHNFNQVHPVQHMGTANDVKSLDIRSDPINADIISPQDCGIACSLCR